jgi:hypothetical protein
MLRLLRQLLGRGSTPSTDGDAEAAFSPELFIYVMIPAAIQPIDRGTRFEDPLEAKLQEAHLGTVSGGGSQLSAPDSEGRKHIEFCGLDVDVTDREQARTLLREELPHLGAPVGTELHYTSNGKRLLDRYEANGWILGVERVMLHPGFDI